MAKLEDARQADWKKYKTTWEAKRVSAKRRSAPNERTA